MTSGGVIHALVAPSAGSVESIGARYSNRATSVLDVLARPGGPHGLPGGTIRP